MGILSLLVKIGVDSSAFESGIKRVENTGERFGNNFKSAVAGRLAQVFSVAAVVAYTKHIMNFAGEIKDMGDQLDLTTDQVQRLQILSTDSGIAFEKLSSVLLKFEAARLAATSGDEKAVKTFEKLKISTDDLNNSQISTLEGAIKAGLAYKQSGKSAETTSAMIELYGVKLKSAGAALADYKKTEKKAIISKEQIDNLDAYNKLFDEQIRLLKVFSVIPIKSQLDKIVKPIEATGQWLDKAESVVELAKKQGSLYATDEYMARKTQLEVAATRTNEFSGPNPPPIGTPQYERVANQKFFLGGSQDQLGRIGGFTGFGASQNSVIRNAIEQTLQLKLIVKNTDKTANNTKD